MSKKAETKNLIFIVIHDPLDQLYAPKVPYCETYVVSRGFIFEIQLDLRQLKYRKDVTDPNEIIRLIFFSDK